MATIQETEKEIIEEFEFLGDDWNEKYRHIIELGKENPGIDEKYKTDDNKVKGCQSNVWMRAWPEGDQLMFEAESDALIVNGLVYLLLRIYSGQTTEAILASEPTFLKEIGLHQHLSPTRSNGLSAMMKQIKYYALAFQAKTE